MAVRLSHIVYGVRVLLTEDAARVGEVFANGGRTTDLAIVFFAKMHLLQLLKDKPQSFSKDNVGEDLRLLIEALFPPSEDAASTAATPRDESWPEVPIKPEMLWEVVEGVFLKLNVRNQTTARPEVAVAAQLTREQRR